MIDVRSIPRCLYTPVYNKELGRGTLPDRYKMVLHLLLYITSWVHKATADRGLLVPANDPLQQRKYSLNNRAIVLLKQ